MCECVFIMIYSINMIAAMRAPSMNARLRSHPRKSVFGVCVPNWIYINGFIQTHKRDKAKQKWHSLHPSRMPRSKSMTIFSNLSILPSHSNRDNFFKFGDLFRFSFISIIHLNSNISFVLFFIISSKFVFIHFYC